jgi:uncharacterized membrane protein YbhN (UPF0104 family)
MKRRWIFALLVIAVIWVVISRFAEISHLLETLSHAQWQWVLAAALLQVGYYLVFAKLYQSCFDAVEVKSRVINLLPLVFAALVVNVVAPSAGVSSAALFMDDANRRGQSPARVAVGSMLVIVANLCAFFVVLVCGMSYLFIQDDLKLYEVLGALTLLVLSGGLTVVLVLGLWRPAWLRRFLTWVQGLVNGLARRLKRSPFLAENWAEYNAQEFREAAVAIALHPDRLLRSLGIALLSHLVDMASLYVLFIAFHQSVEVGVLVA